MARPLRYLPEEDTLVEVTTRTIHGRFLLRPSRKLNELLVGVLGRALEEHPRVAIHAVAHASNHLHLLLTIPDADVLARFMCFVNGNVAREAGRLHAWREKFWGRRYRCIPILDDEAAVDRLRYVLAHGCKEGLVARAEDWPGVNSARALLSDEPLRGIWVDRTAAYEARRRGESVDERDFERSCEVPLLPLSCWRERSADELREAFRSVIDAIADDARASGAGRTNGAARVCEEDPHRRPANVAHSPAPLSHATTRRLRERFADAYREFILLYVRASREHRERSPEVRFPRRCFPPAQAFLFGPARVQARAPT